ncbi:MAG: NifB/NifX family molybdenum-iron cluster-binding protein [Methanosarcina barkeri]|nr:NifB/NifX family molybdenum-iron cluster-binding protein [Methanosarcina sp. ERenArc_MAG2]
MTKIAIPSMSDSGLESDVCAHFGSCEYFTIVDVQDKEAITGIETVSNVSPEGEHNCAAPAIVLKSYNVDTVLVSGIGGRPLMSLAEKKIKVFAGATGKVSDAVQDYNNGLLQELSTTGTCNCSHH